MFRQAALCNINCISHKEEQFFVITGSQLTGLVYIMTFQNYKNFISINSQQVLA